MTRGLVAVPSGFIVGASVLGPRTDRDILSGSIIYLDPSFRRLVEVECPGAPTDLLALDAGTWRAASNVVCRRRSGSGLVCSPAGCMKLPSRPCPK